MPTWLYLMGDADGKPQRQHWGDIPFNAIPKQKCELSKGRHNHWNGGRITVQNRTTQERVVQAGDLGWGSVGTQAHRCSWMDLLSLSPHLCNPTHPLEKECGLWKQRVLLFENLFK